jgi:hypothetical protein
MPASGPTALPPSYAVQSPALTLAAAGHDQMHEDDREEERALWTKVGLGASTATANTVLRGTGSGTTAYGQVVAADISAEAWTAFTPAFAQAGAVSTTVTYARYLVQGKVAHVQIMLTSAATGTGGNPIDIASIPSAIEPKQTGASRSIGSALFVDNNTAIHYTVSVIAISATTYRFIGYNVTNSIGVDPSITLASGDTISLSVTYEIA